eukprot:c12049_g1_i1 orf=3-191(-)
MATVTSTLIKSTNYVILVLKSNRRLKKTKKSKTQRLVPCAICCITKILEIKNKKKRSVSVSVS